MAVFYNDLDDIIVFFSNILDSMCTNYRKYIRFVSSSISVTLCNFIEAIVKYILIFLLQSHKIRFSDSFLDFFPRVIFKLFFELCFMINLTADILKTMAFRYNSFIRKQKNLYRNFQSRSFYIFFVLFSITSVFLTMKKKLPRI